MRSIAEQMGIGRHTIRRYLATGTFPEITQRRQTPSILDPFEPYLRQRWQAGCHNAMQLYREIHDSRLQLARVRLYRAGRHSCAS